MKTTGKKVLIFLLFAFLFWPFAARAWHPRLLEESLLEDGHPAPVVGENRPYLIAPGETLIELARRSSIGYRTMVQANPGFDPWIPPVGAEIILPYSFIPPEGAEEGITINLAEQRLYLIWREDGRRRIRAYAIGIGREGWDTPLGQFSIVSKVTRPSWTPPPNIRAKSPGMPAVVPPGPDNPLGNYWLGLNIKGYGIHGTSKPFGVGRRVSHGCLRLYPEDIEDLFSRVKVGTPVRIVHQPIKVGMKDGRLYLETHLPNDEHPGDPMEEVLRQAVLLPWEGTLQRDAVQKVLEENKGIPTPVSQPIDPQKSSVAAEN